MIKFFASSHFLGVVMIVPSDDQNSDRRLLHKLPHKVHPALELFRDEKSVYGTDAPAYKRGLPVGTRSVLLDPHRTINGIEGSSFGSMHEFVHRKTRPDEPNEPTGRIRLVSLGTRKKIDNFFYCTESIADAVASELGIKDVRSILVHDESTDPLFNEHSNKLREIATYAILLNSSIDPDTNIFPMIVAISETHERLRNWHHSMPVVRNVVSKMVDDGFVAQQHSMNDYFTNVVPDRAQAQRYASARFHCELGDIRLTREILLSNRQSWLIFLNDLKLLVESCEHPDIVKSIRKFQPIDHSIHGHLCGFDSPRIHARAVVNVQLHDGVLSAWRWLQRLKNGGKNDGYRKALIAFNTLQIRDYWKLYEAFRDRRLRLTPIKKALKLHTERYLWLWDDIQAIKNELRDCNKSLNH